MSDDLPELYSRVILGHGRHPRNRRPMADCSHLAHSENPVCGDAMAVFLKINRRGVIRDVAFDGQSCAIATASASLMTQALIGKTQAQAKGLLDCFHGLTSGDAPVPRDGMDVESARLSALSVVRNYPVRERCAALAWQTMLAALESPKEPKMNLDRSVFVFAGSMILISLVLSQLYSPLWLLLTAWVGVMMFQSGFTRFCPAARFFKILGVKSGSAFP